MNLLTSFLFISLFKAFLSQHTSDYNDTSGSGDDNLNIMMNMSSHSHNSQYTEENLRRDIFTNYSKLTIPVKNNENAINLLYGISIESLVFFDQKAEKIKFNTLTTLIWEDQYLKWEDDPRHNNHSHNQEFIVIPNYLIWQPDLELYNSGSKPELFEENGQSKLYKNGLIVYNRPTAYTFSCKLSLEEFPFDTQVCTMTFGSWKYPKAILDLRPFTTMELISSFVTNNQTMTDLFNTQTSHSHFYSDGNHSSQNYIPQFLKDLRNVKNVSVSSSFSHNEWIIDGVTVDHQDYEYLCCPGDLWPNTEFKITLRRNPNKYIILIIMAVFITLSSLTVNILNLTQYRRTYILVFIPLTLIWLQIHSSSKIPVIEYPTKLEKIIQLCFYVTIISAFESGIIYNLVLNRFNKLSLKFKESVYDKMETLGLFQSILIYKTKETEHNNDNKFFIGYVHYILVFDNIFRIALTFVFVVMLALFI